MKKLLLTLIVTLALGGSIFAQDDTWNPLGLESHWPEFYNGPYDFQGAIVASITIDGDIIMQEDPRLYYLEVASFIIENDECRGNLYFLDDQYVLDYGDPYPILNGNPIYYNTTGDAVYFMMYDHLNGIEYGPCTITLEGEPFVVLTGDDNMQGWWDPEQPIFLNFTSPAPEGYLLEIDAYEGETDTYYLIASPVGAVGASAVEGLRTPDFDLFTFDQAEGDEWIDHRDDETYELQPGVGYLYANNTGTDLIFTGSPVAEDNYDVVLAKAEGDDIDFPGWNLVGNPFAVTAYIDRPFYVMNETRDGFMEATGEIAPMQGLFVQATDEGEILTFTTTAPDKSSMLTLNLCSNSKVIDRAAVSFSEGRTLPKFQLNANSTKVCIPVDGQDYAVVNSEPMGEMPVSFKAENNGSYTFSFTSQEVNFNYLHLIDNMTGADVNLLDNPTYSFDALTTDYANRFKLVFATGNANSDDSFAFFSNGNFIVSNDGEATLQVIDVTGRILSSQTINGSASVNVNAAAGVYMLRLVNGDNVRTQKIIVK